MSDERADKTEEESSTTVEALENGGGAPNVATVRALEGYEEQPSSGGSRDEPYSQDRKRSRFL